MVSAEHETLQQRMLHVARCTWSNRSKQGTQGLLEGTQGLLESTQGLLKGTQALLEGTQGLLEGTQTCCLTTIYGVCSSRSRGCAGMTCAVPSCSVVACAHAHTHGRARECVCAEPCA